LACADSDISPISSKNNVPPSACSNFPLFRSFEPEYEPFSDPNNSASINVSAIAAQLTRTKGLEALYDAFWMAQAISSFPVPWPAGNQYTAIASGNQGDGFF
jgi:hypothetical protein